MRATTVQSPSTIANTQAPACPDPQDLLQKMQKLSQKIQSILPDVQGRDPNFPNDKHKYQEKLHRFTHKWDKLKTEFKSLPESNQPQYQKGFHQVSQNIKSYLRIIRKAVNPQHTSATSTVNLSNVMISRQAGLI